MIWHRCITTLILDQDGCAWIYIYKRSPLVIISVCTTYLHHTTQGCILTSFNMLSKVHTVLQISDGKCLMISQTFLMCIATKFHQSDCSLHEKPLEQWRWKTQSWHNHIQAQQKMPWNMSNNKTGLIGANGLWTGWTIDIKANIQTSFWDSTNKNYFYLKHIDSAFFFFF